MTDFLSLANASRPQMMPSAPAGAGWMAGTLYGMDMNRHDQFLQEAATLAKLDAQRKAQEAEEFNLGTPGRLADIGMKNAQSQNNLDAYQQDGVGRDTAMTNAQTKGISSKEEQVKILAPYFNQLGGEDEDAARQAYEVLKEKLPRVASVPYEKLRKEAKARLGGMTVNNPEQINKESMQSLKNEGALDVKKLGIEGQRQVAEIMAQGRKEIEQMKIQNPTMWKSLLDLAGGDAAVALRMHTYSRIAPILQAGKNATDQANAVLPKGKQMPAPTPIEGASPPESAPTPVTTTKEPDYKVGDMWSKTGRPNDGKKIIRIGRDKKTNRRVLLLEGGEQVTP